MENNNNSIEIEDGVILTDKDGEEKTNLTTTTNTNTNTNTLNSSGADYPDDLDESTEYSSLNNKKSIRNLPSDSPSPSPLSPTPISPTLSQSSNNINNNEEKEVPLETTINISGSNTGLSTSSTSISTPTITSLNNSIIAEQPGQTIDTEKLTNDGIHSSKKDKKKKATETTISSSSSNSSSNNDNDKKEINIEKSNTTFEISTDNLEISNNNNNTTTTTTTTITTSTSTTNQKELSNSSNPNSPESLKIEYRDNITPIEEDYDRKQYFEYRDSHRENGEIGTPTMKAEPDINKKYDDANKERHLKETTKWGYFKFLFNKNKYRWDINVNPRFYLAAQIITRFGFLSKTILYCSLGVLSLAAAVDKEREVQGPDGVFEELQEMFSGGVIILLLLGLWSYGCWGIFYIVFDVDQLGYKSAGAILKRFGRIFSSGFYFVLGVDAARVLAHTRKQESGTSHILGFLYDYIIGQIVVCVLGVTFFVVSIVYLVYFIKPDKFKRELSTERMNKYLYWSALGFARIGAVGRSMFFGAFGGVLIKAVADIHRGLEPDTGLLGFQGVFQQIAIYNTSLLFIIAILIMFYALWCFWLMFFRRLPAHQDAVTARALLGTKINKKYVFNGILFRIKRNKDEPDSDTEDEHHDHANNDGNGNNLEELNNNNNNQIDQEKVV